jgi:lipoprotein-anchoring transpeptidase ErfK/SrfK
MIHTILYSKWGGQDPEYVDVVDDRLGMNLSLSCIRLSLENARFIYNNIPTGTRLVVYE